MQRLVSLIKNKFDEIDDSTKGFILMISPFIGGLLGLIIVGISYLIWKWNSYFMFRLEENIMKRITDSELLELPFGSKIRVIWHNSNHHPKNDEYYGIIFGDKIGYEDGEFDDTRTIAECVFNDWCMVYLITE